MNQASHRQLDIYRLTLQLINVCRPLVPRIKRFNRRTAAQLVESLASTLQNLSEGVRRTGADGPHLISVALGSCNEVRAILDTVCAFGVITTQDGEHAEALADRICAMGYRLRQKMM